MKFKIAILLLFIILIQKNAFSYSKEQDFLNYTKKINKLIDIADYDKAIQELKSTRKNDLYYKKKIEILYNLYLERANDNLKEKDYLASKKYFLELYNLIESTNLFDSDKKHYIEENIIKINENIIIELYNQNEYEKIISISKEIISKNPKKSSLYSLLAISLYRSNRKKEAFKFLEESMKKFPNSDLIYYNLACMYSLENKKEKALYFLQKSIYLNPKNKEKAKLDSDFNNINSKNDFFTIVGTPKKDNLNIFFKEMLKRVMTIDTNKK